MKNKIAVITILAILAFGSMVAKATTITTFGQAPVGTTFGGNGIPTDQTQVGIVDGVVSLTLNAHASTIGQTIANDGAGNYYITAGSVYNLDFAAVNNGNTPALFQLRYSNLGTAMADMGLWNLTASYALSQNIQDSEKPGFAFLSTGVSGFVTPPVGGFNFTYASGTLDVILQQYDVSGAILGQSEITITEGDMPSGSVPDSTSTLGLLGASMVGLVTLGKRRAIKFA